MKKMLRSAVYAGMAVVFVLAVAARIHAVKAYRGKEIVSIDGEWKKAGTPVEAHPVMVQDIPVYTRFTVTMVDAQHARGYVTGELKDALKAGQFICDLGDAFEECAHVTRVADDIDIDTGMFPVDVEFAAPREAGTSLILSAHTRTLRGAMAVPNELLDVDAGDYYLWKDDGGRARRVKVTVGSRNGYGAVITGGLRTGDLVVFSGQSALTENDKLRVISTVPVSKEGRR